jgi:hypothetical protein
MECFERKRDEVERKGGGGETGGADGRTSVLVFSCPFFSFQYNRRAWSADEMAIPSILRDMGPNDIEAE